MVSVRCSTWTKNVRHSAEGHRSDDPCERWSTRVTRDRADGGGGPPGTYHEVALLHRRPSHTREGSSPDLGVGNRKPATGHHGGHDPNEEVLCPGLPRKQGEIHSVHQVADLLDPFGSPLDHDAPGFVGLGDVAVDFQRDVRIRQRRGQLRPSRGSEHYCSVIDRVVEGENVRMVIHPYGEAAYLLGAE